MYALETWNAEGFGNLAYPDTLRIVIPGSTLITIGLQTAFFTLFLSMLRFQRR